MSLTKLFLLFVALLFVGLSTIVGYWLALEFMKGEYSVKFESPAAVSSKVLNEKLADMSYTTRSLTQFFKSSSYVEKDEFSGFTSLIFNQFDYVSAVAYFESKNIQEDGDFQLVYFDKSVDYAFLSESGIETVFSQYVSNIKFHSDSAIASKITPLNTKDGFYSVVIERISGTHTFIVMVVDIRAILRSVLQNPITHRFAIYRLQGEAQFLEYSAVPNFSLQQADFSAELTFFNNRWKLEIQNPFERTSASFYLILAGFLVVSLFILVLVAILLRMKRLYEQREVAIYELKFAQEKLVEAEKINAMGGLVAGISHEVNTPLGIGITSISHLKALLDDVNTDFTNGVLDSRKFEDFVESSHDLVSMALNNMDKASKLVAAFKRVDVINADHAKEVEEVDLNEFAGQFIELYQSECGGEKIKFHLNVDESLHVYTYASVLSQVLTYLTTNTLMHSNRADAQSCGVFLTIGRYKEDGKVWLKFEDKGVGVDEGCLKKIFEPFYTTKRGEGSVGLGLSVVYNLVKSKLKSDLFYGSKINQGLWIEFELKNLKGV
ncbi:sensor histidine kinase [Alteromonas sp. a30]|uniref:sensor histidine kinase n=1 Tax=Alteromonas sp. a30 TaxID=2730917 RepID=UPI002282C96C|nr:HAMP domain-containing sensor histidine kinase [Alteromonas sp. a30]MCY7295595.1 HAMP domain-containing histidine kinase [Alteromonas sp. a30]